MSEKSVSQKLLIKPGCSFLLINPPRGYRELLADLPENVSVVAQASAPVDVIQFFASTQQELEEQLSRVKALLKPKSLLWVTYPKGTSKIPSEINRDSIVETARGVGYEGVAMVAVDKDWSALRLKVI